jgi:predicted transposase YbfD/YdcC
VLRVKANQPTLYDLHDRHEGIALLFADPVSPLATARQRDRHGDRWEVRELAVSQELNGWAEWPHLAQVGRLVHTCRCKGQTRREASYLITSLSPDEASPRRLLELVRGHWGIENRLHWVRDVTFDEDRCQVRSGAAPQVMAALRNLVIGLFRRGGVSNIAAALRTLAGQPHRALALVTSN